jgi:hypothetical protein
MPKHRSVALDKGVISHKNKGYSENNRETTAGDVELMGISIYTTL